VWTACGRISLSDRLDQRGIGLTGQSLPVESIERCEDIVASRPLADIEGRRSSVTRLVTWLDIGRLNRLVGELRVPEVRADQQAQAEQHYWKTEQRADQLARHSRRPADGTCFPTFSSVTVRTVELCIEHAHARELG